MRRGNIALTWVVQVHANGRDDPPITDNVLAQNFAVAANQQTVTVHLRPPAWRGEVFP